METRLTGNYRDFIIPPGETISEILEERSITQKELALKTGVSEKHISNIINGKAAISSAFSKKLEYVLGVDASFWDNLESKYQRDLIEYQQMLDITNEEKAILKNLKEFIHWLESLVLIPKNLDDVSLVIQLRKILEISNLTLIPKVAINAAFRTGTSKMDVYVLYAWIKMCEMITAKDTCDTPLDKGKLNEYIPEFRCLTMEPVDKMQQRLTEIFRDCGIVFRIVPNFKGAPVQGFIKSYQDKTILCMTIRQSFADIFWFTLFHEIKHILSEDYKRELVDFSHCEDEQEKAADLFARDNLIDAEKYNRFVDCGVFERNSVLKFADEIGIAPFIVVGRLQKEGHLPYNQLTDLKVRFVWK